MLLARNILAFLLGLVIGSLVNMGLILLGHRLVPLPAGADVSTLDSLANSIHLFGPEHFLFPFLAHALGTLVGAVLAYAIAASRRRVLALLVGAAFLAGGITNVFTLPAPAWFNAVDLVLAYLPMAWLGMYIGSRLRPAAGGTSS